LKKNHQRGQLFKLIEEQVKKDHETIKINR